MAYGERYYHVFCDKHSNTFRASILEDDYVGSSALIEGGPSPVVIRYESFSDYKFDTIRASQCIITLVASDTFNSQNFYTGDEKKFKIEILKNGSLYWTGYMMPNGLREEFKSAPYYITITATDYLPGIKNIKYLQADGSQYSGRHTFVEIINQCTEKTGLGLTLDTYVNVYPTALTPGPTVDPLNETDVNVQTFIENRNRDLSGVEGGAGRGMGGPRPRNRYPSQDAKSDKDRPMNCYEVISYNATLWNSRFFQEDARWKFERINYKYLQGTIRHYDSSGTLSGTSTRPAPRLVDCINQDNKLIGAQHTLSMDRVFKRATVEYRFAFDDAQNNVTQFLRNGDFEDYVPPDMWNYWGGSPGVNPTHVTLNGNNGMWIENVSNKQYYVQSWPIEVTEGDELRFEFTVRLRPGMAGDNVQYVLFRVHVDGNFNFSSGSGQRPPYSTDRVAYLYNYNGRGKWAGEELYIAVPINPPTQEGQLVTAILPTEPLPGSGKMYVRMYGTADNFGGSIPGGQMGGFDTGPQFGGLVTSTFGVTEVYDIKVGKINKASGDEDAETTSYVEEQPGNFTDEPEIITIINADDAEPSHISDIQVHDGGVKTTLWTVDGQPEYQPDTIGKVIARSVLEQYKAPYHIIEGTIKGPDLKFSDVFQFNIPGVSGELYLVQKGDFDLARSELQSAVLVQISDEVVDSDGTIDGNDTNPNWARTGWQRCVRDASGHTTGDTEAEEKDYNPYSPTYGQTRWVNLGNIGGCGGSAYYEYLWAASGEILDQNDLQNWKFVEETDQVTVWFTSTGGKWLWFLHRPEAGTVTSVLDIEAEETIADWSYQSDVVVAGITFKAMRMNYYTGRFTELPKTFVFT